jgi:hypothetical protein
MPVFQAEVTWAWEAVTVMEATHATVVLAVETSAQEAAVARDSAVILIKDVGDRAALAEKEARERVSRVEVESAMALASVREEAKGLVRKITLLEGDLAEAPRAREVVEENSHGLSDTAVGDV